MPLEFMSFWTTPNLLLLFLGKQSQKFLQNLGKLVINYFLPKLLVTYGNVLDNRSLIQEIPSPRDPTQHKRNGLIPFQKCQR